MGHINRNILLILWLLLLPLVCLADGKVWSADNIDIVYLKDKTQYVCDPDNIISQADRDSANYYLGLLEKECGVQSVFVICNYVENQDCFRMAQDIGNNYGVGSKKTRRGLVTVVAVEDRKYFIAPGMGLEQDLTDVDCGDIGRHLIADNMKEGESGKAVYMTAKALYQKVKTGSTGFESVDDPTGDEDLDFVTVFFLLIIFGPFIYSIIRWILEQMGIVKPSPKSKSHRRGKDDDDWFPPFIFGGGGGFGSSGGGFSGGSFGGGSFGGGGAGGGW